MGNYHGCYIDPTRTCPSSLQDPITCTQSPAFDDEPRTVRNCWYNTDRVGVQVLLPIVLIFCTIIAIALLYKFRQVSCNTHASSIS